MPAPCALDVSPITPPHNYLTNPTAQLFYVMIVVVIMMASGTTDPVRRATDKAWPSTRKTLNTPGSDGSGSNDADAVYCRNNVDTNPVCSRFWALGEVVNDGCPIGLPNYMSVYTATQNCSAAASVADPASGTTTECEAFAATCALCEAACKEQQILDIKDALLPASYFVFFLCGYLFVVCVLNTFLIHLDEIEGGKKLLGTGMNAILAMLSFVVVIIGSYGAYNASENDAASGEIPTSMWILIGSGVFALLVSGLAVFALQADNHFLLRVSTLVLTFTGIFTLCVALLLGVASGAVMDDMGYYYDVNYFKMRNALEKADNTYCQMSKEECLDLTTENIPVYAKDGDGVKIADVPPITRDQIWQNQHFEAAKEAGKTGAAAWLAPCLTTGVCIFCDPFAEVLQTEWVGVHDGSANISLFAEAVTGEPCQTEFTNQPHYTESPSCVLGAPKVNWTMATGMDIGPLFGSVPNDATALGGQAYQEPKAGLSPFELANLIENYTQSTWNPSVVASMGRCEVAIQEYVTNGDTCIEDLAAGAAGYGTYKQDCDACNSLTLPFLFIHESTGETYMQCSNFFIGHMLYECGLDGASAATCQDEFYTDEDKVAHATFMADLALKDGSRSKFCGYSDDACKAKIQNFVESSMSTIAIFGCIFLVFFVGVIYFTLEAIKFYRGGDDGDDDDDEPDDGAKGEDEEEV